jgi:hypothetical protein
MKKFFSMMVAFATLFAFVACTKSSNGTDEPKPGNDTQLATPAPQVTEEGDTYFTVAWEPVQGAEAYIVNLKSTNVTVTETSYTFENLNAGNYTVNVIATGTGYKNSKPGQVSVTLTGATSVNWFTQTVTLAEENAEKGYGPYNALNISWQGEGVKELYYGIFMTASAEGASDQTIISNLDDYLPAEYLTEVNTADGLAWIAAPVNGGTSYTVFAYVTNEAGVTFLARTAITTETAKPSAAALSWVGTWTVKSHAIYSIDQEGNGTESAYEEEFTVMIHPSQNDPNEVIIDGLSVLGAEQGFVTSAIVYDENTMYPLAGTYLGESQDGSFGYYWLAWYDFGISAEELPFASVTKDEAGVVTSTNKLEFEKDGKPVPVECYCCDVFGVTETGQIYFLIEQFPGVFRTGDMEWNKTDSSASAKALNYTGINTPGMMSSVVLK